MAVYGFSNCDGQNGSRTGTMKYTRRMPEPDTALETAAQSYFDWDLLWHMVDAQIEFLGWTKQQAARDAGVSKSKFTARKPVSIENLGKLCRWLHLPLDVFLKRELSIPAQQRYAELIATYATPEDIQRRFDAAFATARVERASNSSHCATRA